MVSTYKIAKFEYSIKSHLFYNRCDRIKKRIEILENFRQTLNILKNEHNFTLKNLEDAVIIFGTYTRIDENGNLV